MSQITCISDSKNDSQVLGFFSSLHKNLFRILHLLETMRIFLIPIRNSEKVSAFSYDISKRSSHSYQILDIRFFPHENPLLPIRFIIGVLSFLLDSRQECFCCYQIHNKGHLLLIRPFKMSLLIPTKFSRRVPSLLTDAE